MEIVFNRLPIDGYVTMIEAHDASLTDSPGDHIRKKIELLRGVIDGVEGPLDEAGLTSQDVVDFLLSDLAMIHGIFREYVSTMTGGLAKNSETPPAASSG
jgi:hypothetical protein